MNSTETAEIAIGLSLVAVAIGIVTYKYYNRSNLDGRPVKVVEKEREFEDTTASYNANGPGAPLNIYSEKKYVPTINNTEQQKINNTLKNYNNSDVNPTNSTKVVPQPPQNIEFPPDPKKFKPSNIPSEKNLEEEQVRLEKEFGILKRYDKYTKPPGQKTK